MTLAHLDDALTDLCRLAGRLDREQLLAVLAPFPEPDLIRLGQVVGSIYDAVTEDIASRAERG